MRWQSRNLRIKKPAVKPGLSIRNGRSRSVCVLMVGRAQFIFRSLRIVVKTGVYRRRKQETAKSFWEKDGEGMQSGKA